MIRVVLVTLLSAAAIATAIAWPISSCFTLHFDAYDDVRWISVGIEHGVLGCRIELDKSTADAAPETERLWELGEFLLYRTAAARVAGFGLPLWALVVLFGAYPVTAFMRGPWRRHRRRKKGLCLQCGYDLRGKTSGICPECGRER